MCVVRETVPLPESISNANGTPGGGPSEPESWGPGFRMELSLSLASMSPGCLQPFGVLKILGWTTQSPCSQGAYILLEEGKPTSKYEFLLVIRHMKKIKNKRGRERAPGGGEMCSEKTAPKKKHLSEDSNNKVDPTLSRPGKHSGGGSGQILPQTKQRPPSPLTSNQLSFRQY